MLNKLRKSSHAKLIREKLLTIPAVNHRVKSFLAEQEKQRITREVRCIERQLERHHILWEFLMSDRVITDNENDHRTFAEVTDAGVVVSYMNGRAVGQEHAGPVFHRFDVLNWGGM